jgi:uncharacterized protein DUF1579
MKTHWIIVIAALCSWTFVAQTSIAKDKAAQKKKGHGHNHGKDKSHGHDHAAHGDKDGHGDHGGQQMDAEGMAWMMHSMVGPKHEQMKPMVGSWTYSGKFWFEPDSEPMLSTGTVEAKMILGGRFLQSHWSGTSFFPGPPFEGLSTMGYDNTQKKFHSTWYDTMSTSLTKSEGTSDNSGKVFTMTGTHYDPSKKAEEQSRSVMTIINENKYKMEGFGKKDGKEFKSMEIVVTRK